MANCDTTSVSEVLADSFPSMTLSNMEPDTTAFNRTNVNSPESPSMVEVRNQEAGRDNEVSLTNIRERSIQKAKIVEQYSRFEQYGDSVMECVKYADNDTIVTPFVKTALLSSLQFWMDIYSKGRNMITYEVDTDSDDEKLGIAALLPYCVKAKKVLILSPSKLMSNELGQTMEISMTHSSLIDQLDIRNCEDGYKLHVTPLVMESLDEVKDYSKIENNVVIINADGNVVDLARLLDMFDLLIGYDCQYPIPSKWTNIVNHFLDHKKKVFFLGDKRAVRRSQLSHRYPKDGRTECDCSRWYKGH